MAVNVNVNALPAGGDASEAVNVNATAQWLAGACEGYSGADLQAVLTTARLEAIHDALDEVPNLEGGALDEVPNLEGGALDASELPNLASGGGGGGSSGGGGGGGGGGGSGGGGSSSRRGLRPDFWVALLWRRLVGLRVLRADVHAHEAAPYENSNSVPPLLPLRVYAFCSRQKTPSGGLVLSGGVILLLINLGTHAAEADVSTLLPRATNGSVAAQDDATLGFDGGARALAPKTPRTTPRHEWHLNASSFYATEAVLNGMPLHSTDSEVPELPPPLVIDEGTVVHVSPHSASFVEFLSAHWPECQ